MVHQLNTLSGVLLATLLVACGGGGGGGDDGDSAPQTAASALSGTWAGFGEDVGAPGPIFEVQASISNSGDITQILLNQVDSGVTAQLAGILINDRVFAWIANTGATLVATRSPSNNYLSYADDDLGIAVLQRGTTRTGNLSVADLTGTWSGLEWGADSSFSNFAAVSATLSFGTISGNSVDLTFSDALGCTAVATVSVVDSRGTIAGNFAGTSGDPDCIPSGELRGFVSPDQQFVSAYACPVLNSLNYPENCVFLALDRQ